MHFIWTYDGSCRYLTTNKCALVNKMLLTECLMVTDDWRYRHAALMAISACGEGCHQQMETMLGNVLEAILPFLKDPVRYWPKLMAHGAIQVGSADI